MKNEIRAINMKTAINYTFYKFVKNNQITFIKLYHILSYLIILYYFFCDYQSKTVYFTQKSKCIGYK